MRTLRASKNKNKRSLNDTSDAEPPRKKHKCNDPDFAHLLDKCGEIGNKMREKYEEKISSNNSLRHELNEANQHIEKMKNDNPYR